MDPSSTPDNLAEMPEGEMPEGALEAMREAEAEAETQSDEAYAGHRKARRRVRE